MLLFGIDIDSDDRLKLDDNSSSSKFDLNVRLGAEGSLTKGK